MRYLEAVLALYLLNGEASIVNRVAIEPMGSFVGSWGIILVTMM